MNAQEQLVADVADKIVIEIASGEFARVARLKSGSSIIQLKSPGGSWETTHTSYDDEKNTAVWADYRAMAAQYAARAAEPAAAPAAAVAEMAAIAQESAQAIVMIATTELEGHPQALAFWPDSAERRESVEAICASVRGCGVRQPLTVCRKSGGDGWWVLDGCTRLEAARAADIGLVPCREIGAGAEEIADEIFVSNMERTRFPSAVRVMRYLEMNADAVLATAERTAAENGALGGRGKKGVSRDTTFSADVIAERLKVSKMDVLAGIELLRCRRGGLTLRINAADRSRLLVKATEEEQAGVEAAYRACLAGTPLRRWAPAARGHAATADKARRAPCYGDLATRSLVSLNTVFEHWDEMPEADQEGFTGLWKKLLVKLPPEAMLATRKLLPPL